ncbi:Clp protease N-terminal domain-containing protein [Streptomyces sp. FH025]|uniref:Clp protease N-terminal domain-containing protein n=1 Tax=Streptomyces sp. FH025 TaxID=2815937 RepID=UPI001AA003C9|nr:hypothetical protein [Streptomyces sp. FH025]
MFERFTDAARQVVVTAQQEARELRHDHIGTEHLLLAGEGLGAKVIADHGLDVVAVRRAVEATLA